eukprot:933528_1
MDFKNDALWNAVGSRNLAEVKQLVAQNADVNMICPDGWVRDEHAGGGGRTLLHHAAWAGSLPVFVFLGTHGGNPLQRRVKNWAQPRGNTPFHHATMYGRADIVQWCLEHGAPVDMAGEQGHTALHLAAKFNYPDIVTILLRFGASPSPVTRDQKRAIDIAASNEIRELIRFGGHPEWDERPGVSSNTNLNSTSEAKSETSKSPINGASTEKAVNSESNYKSKDIKCINVKPAQNPVDSTDYFRHHSTKRIQNSHKIKV